MHKNYTQQSDKSCPPEYNFEPITLSFNKRLLDHQKNQLMFNKSMKKIPQFHPNHQNEQLISQLYLLLSNEQVRKNMTAGLHERVEKVLAAAEAQQINQKGYSDCRKINQLLTQQQNIQIHDKQNAKYNNQPHKNTDMKLDKIPACLQNFSSPNLFSLKKLKKDNNKQNYQHRGIFNLKKGLQTKAQNNKKAVNTQYSQSKQKYQGSSIKKLKYIDNQFNGTSNCSKPKPRVQIRPKSKQLNHNKREQEKKSERSETNTKGGKRFQKSEQKSGSNTAKRFQSNQKHPLSLNTTVFTTRNNQVEKKPSKSNLIRDKSKSPIKANIQSQKSKIIQYNKEKQRTKSKQKQRRHFTEQEYYYEQQDQNAMYNTHSDEQLFKQNQKQRSMLPLNQYRRPTNKQDQRYEDSPIKTHNILEQTGSFQFIDKIFKLQKDAQTEQKQLEAKIKSLKNMITNEKSTIDNTNKSISRLQQEENTITLNNGFIFSKNKQIHKKLQNMWGEVKTLNSNILDIRKQNQQINNSLGEERQLLLMYTTVIQQLKQQLKIEIDQRDQYRKRLTLSKKNQLASKIKANSTKEKTELILSNVRESISKWIS